MGYSELACGGPQCAIIDATTGTGGAVQQVELCINAMSNTMFSLPASSQSIIVPAGLSTMVYGSVAGSPISFTQSVSCPTEVSPCDASASIGSIFGGTVPITLNPGSLPAGTVYTQNFFTNGQTQSLPVNVVGGVRRDSFPWLVSNTGSSTSVTFTGCGAIGCSLFYRCSASNSYRSVQVSAQSASQITFTFQASAYVYGLAAVYCYFQD